LADSENRDIKNKKEVVSFLINEKYADAFLIVLNG
jgi:hypothetical protein